MDQPVHRTPTAEVLPLLRDAGHQDCMMEDVLMETRSLHLCKVNVNHCGP